MPLYSWVGLHQNGVQCSGFEHAANKQQLQQRLQQTAIFVVTIQSPRLAIFTLLFNKIRSQQITMLLEQLTILICGKIPLLTAFQILTQETSAGHLKTLLTSCSGSLASGQTLTVTCQQHPRYFNPLICNLIHVGEQTGKLEQILQELTNYLLLIEQQKTKIINTLLYPSIIFAVTIIVAIILLFFVMPQFALLYQQMHATLPTYTQTLLFLAAVCQQYWLAALLAISSLGLLLYLCQDSVKFASLNSWLAQLPLQLPIIRLLIQKNIFIRLVKVIALVYQTGLPLVTAVNLAATVIPYYGYQKALQHTALQLEQGQTLALAMTMQKLFPAKMLRLIALGEETGTLATMLERIAIIYTTELTISLERLHKLLEPVLMLLLSIIVGGLIIGIYLPIFQLGNLL